MRSPLPRSPWYSCPKPDAAAPARLWCIPFAGGGTTAWFPFTARFPGLAEVVAVRPPGRESRLAEAPLTTLTALANATANALQPLIRPTDFLFGHSLGALVAFEIVRLWRTRGATVPRGLIVAGLRAPDLPRRETDMTHLPDEAFLQEVDERFGGLPPEVRNDPGLRELILPPLRADMAAYESYQHQPGAPLALPILAINSDGDPTVNREEALGWAKLTTGEFTPKFLPGGHMFILSDPAPVAELIREFLVRHA